jgi:uncharacterized protein YggE
MRNVALAGVLAAAAALVSPVAAAAAESAPGPFIEVTAEAETRATPDLAYLDFGVMTRADTAASAAQQNAQRMKAVLAAVRAALGPNAQIGTGMYNVRAEYSQNREGGEPRVIGYVATNVVRLETAELARIGEVIDAALKAGANQVQRIAFGLSDPATPRRSALRDAVARAQAEAEAIASALKATLGPVQSVIDQDMGPVRPLAQEGMLMRAQAAATPIEPGVVNVRARVVLRVLISRQP